MTRVIGISIYGPLIPNTPVELQGVGKKELGSNNYVSFEINADWPDTHLFINADGYEPYSHHVSLPLDGKNKDIILADNGPTGPDIINFPNLKSLTITLSPIQVAEREFVINGTRYKPKIASDFMLVLKKSQGIDITPLIKQRKEAGADMLRIFTTAYNIAILDPRKYDVPSILGAVLDDIHSFGMRAEVEGFADAQVLGLTYDEKQFHHEVVNDVIKSKGSVDIYDLCNEFDKNGIDPNEFSKVNDVISSRGSKQNNKPPSHPYWDFGTYHPRRDGDGYYFIKYLADITPQSEIYTGVESEPVANIPILPDEPIGFQTDIEVGRRANYPGFAYRIGSIYSMYLNGSCFHSTNGIFSEPFDDVTMKCALAHFKGCDDARKGW